MSGEPFESPHEAKDEFSASWRRAYDESRGRQSTTISERPHPSIEWKINPGAKLTDIAELAVHAPTATNEPDTYVLRVTLVISSRDRDLEDYSFRLGLRAVHLDLDTTSYQIAPESLLVERFPSANYRRTANGIDVTGPRTSDGVLDGLVLGHEPYGHIVAVGDNGPLTVSVVAGRNDFSIESVPNLNGEIMKSINRMHVLAALFWDGAKKDAAHRAVLAETTIVRVEKNEATS